MSLLALLTIVVSYTTIKNDNNATDTLPTNFLTLHFTLITQLLFMLITDTSYNISIQVFKLSLVLPIALDCVDLSTIM